MPEAVVPATIVFPIFNFVLRAVQTGYELASVPAETNDYLKTISQVLTDLKTARVLRNETAASLNNDDLSRVDQVIRGTEEAMAGLEKLVERARVDMSVHNNDRTVRAQSRVMWVMRESTRVGAALNRLTIASQSLHTEMNMMRLVKHVPVYGQAVLDTMPKPFWNQSQFDSYQPQHLQDTLLALKERREFFSHRHSLSRSSTTTQRLPQTSFGLGHPSPAPLRDDTAATASIINVTDYIQQNESILSSLAPDLSAGPRNDLIPAIIIDPQDETNTGTMLIELDGGTPTRIQPEPRTYSMSVPNLPFPTMAGAPGSASVANLVPRLDRLSLTPDSSSSTRRRSALPPNASSTNTSSRLLSRERMPSSGIMQSTTVIPGQRRPRRLQWLEPGEEASLGSPVSEARAQTQAQQQITDLDGTPPDEPPPSYSSSLVSDIAAGSAPAGADVARTATRRRPPRVHNLPPPEPPTAPTTHLDSRPSTGRSMGTRPSRLDWAVDQHLAEAARLDIGARW